MKQRRLTHASCVWRRQQRRPTHASCVWRRQRRKRSMKFSINRAGSNLLFSSPCGLRQFIQELSSRLSSYRNWRQLVLRAQSEHRVHTGTLWEFMLGLSRRLSWQPVGLWELRQELSRRLNSAGDWVQTGATTTGATRTRTLHATIERTGLCTGGWILIVKWVLEIHIRPNLPQDLIYRILYYCCCTCHFSYILDRC